jgi:O-antigen/teichoic acid export membrane protein
MPGLISRAAVLTFSRVSNFAIQLFSPLLLVRLLEVSSYGEYQEFMIYAMLLVTVCSFAIDSSLTYFLPRFPERERALLTQTSMLTLVITLLVLPLLLLAKPLFLKFASFDFLAPLAAYVFFFVNLNWLEYFWIAKRQTHIVLYYTAVRLLVRFGVLLAVAYITRNVSMILWSLVAVEALRVLVTFVYFSRRRTFTSDIRRTEIEEQLRFATPIGSAALVQSASRSVGKIFISSTLGPAALAYYAAGSYLQPVVRVLRKGVEDAVYPELVRARTEPGAALRLWQRVNVLNCVLSFPIFVLLTYYAEPIVRALFTEAYLPAVPIFMIYAVFLLRRCFNTDVLLRTTGQSGFMLSGALGALGLNVLLIAAFSQSLGLVGPAVALIVAEICQELYYAHRARRMLGLRIADLADWRGIGRVAVSCLAASPILVAGHLLPGPALMRTAVTALIFFVLVLFIAYRLGVGDVGRVATFVWRRLAARTRRLRPT